MTRAKKIAYVAMVVLFLFPTLIFATGASASNNHHNWNWNTGHHWWGGCDFGRKHDDENKCIWRTITFNNKPMKVCLPPSG